MKECNQSMLFPLELTKDLVVDFGGGDLSSDGGMLLLAQADARAGLTKAMTQGMLDRRQQGKVTHTLPKMIQTRVIAIAGGYEDCNDLDTLRHDPLLKTACGECPKGDALASQPTVSRLENAVSGRELRRMAIALAQRVIAQLPAQTKSVIVDVDASEDPCHGQQEFEGFNKYYGTHCYLPLFVHLTDDEGSQWPIGALLRPGRCNPLLGVRGVLKWVVRLLRARFPKLRIIVRADSGFGSERVLRCCDKLEVDYVIGLSTNKRLAVLGTSAQMQCALAYQWEGNGCRVYDEFAYKAGTWKGPRRTIVKVEMIQRELNPRYVVTNITDLDPEAIYKLYCGRGEQENRIKEIKLDLASGRTSCHRFMANQARLLMHLAAHVLWCVIRAAAKGTRWEKAQVGTLRLQVQKVAARIMESVRRVVVHLCSSYPYQTEWRQLQDALAKPAM